MVWPLVKSVLLGLIVAIQLHGHTGCLEEERMGLLEIKEFVRFNADDVDRLLPSWADDPESDCCGWDRVTCNSTTGHVMELNLYNMRELYEDKDIIWYEIDENIIWFLNISLFQTFKELRTLNLSANGIAGWIENKGFESLLRLKRLETLDLGYNMFNRSIIQKLRLLKSLKTLILSFNQVEGSIPTKELSIFEDLEILDLGHNSLSGSLTIQGSKSFSKLGKLKQLDLSENEFDIEILRFLGTLPALKSLNLQDTLMGSLDQDSKSLLNLSKLEQLDLGNNNLSKEILRSLGKLSALKSLQLNDNFMEGSLCDEDFTSLGNLETLSLSGNKLNGSLPTQGICGLKKLKELDLSWNSFEGTLPPCLYNLTSLQLLDTSGYQFKGNISSLIAGLTSLEYIDLSYNLFEGFSFSSFANISKLEFIRFACGSVKLDIETEDSSWVPLFQLKFLAISNCSLNKLSHQIPTFLFHQHSLRVLDFSYNELKGPFPSWLLENNTRLEFVALNNNFFKGHLHLSLPLNLTYSMDVSNNQLNGQLQQNFGNILPKIRFLNLSQNAFEGYLPSSIGNMSLLDVVNLSFNNFSGEVPRELVTGCLQLQILDLSNNNFHGHLLSRNFNLTELRILKINDNQFSGPLSNVLSKCSFLSVLDVCNNNMSDKIPTWICNQQALDTLLLRNNFFQGQITCDTVQFRLLDLSENSLSGSLPSWSSNVLRHVHLGKNNFSGSIPKAFLSITGLVTLDISDNKLSGRIPNAIGKLLSLKVLLLRGNRLRGKIPIQLCQLIEINIMDLSNNLLSGTIPHCFHRISSSFLFNIPWSAHIQIMPYQYTILQKIIKMPFLGLSDGSGILDEGEHYDEFGGQNEVNFVTKYRLSSYKGGVLDYMVGLDFSCNNLTGGIPPELGQLSAILALNLSHNQLTSSIPETLSNLTQLESLDLSHNNLNGEIPPQLIKLNFLEVFSVAYNNLSGRTPETKAQFGTFSASSYEGNPFLCGLPLEKNCTSIEDSPPTPTKSSDVSDGKWYKVDLVVFLASFCATYIMFFLGVVTVLYINPYWRLRCFNLVEDCMYSCYYFVANNLCKLSARLYN